MAPILRLTVPSYSLCIGLGIAAGCLVVLFRAGQYGLTRKKVLVAYAAALLGAVVGGRMLYVVQGLPQLMEDQSTLRTFVQYVSRAGQVFYGGMLGALAGVYVAARILRCSGSTLMDALLPALPLGQAFGRVGCFMAGCCYGLPSSVGVFMHSAAAPSGIRLFPIQLVESVCTFALFVLLVRMRRDSPPGRLLGTYLSGYGMARFAIEFYRGDAVRGFIGPLSVSQWISLGCIAAGTYLLWKAHRMDSAAGAGRSTGSMDTELDGISRNGLERL